MCGYGSGCVDMWVCGCGCVGCGCVGCECVSVYVGV